MKQTVDEYINSFPEDIRKVLEELRGIIKNELPAEIEEIISYGIPTVKLNGKHVIYFAGYKDHISIHPTTEQLEKEVPEVLKYKTGKGTLQFPLDKPLPFSLIKKITKVKLDENLARTKSY